jgi:hypothetical protein
MLHGIKVGTLSFLGGRWGTDLGQVPIKETRRGEPNGKSARASAPLERVGLGSAQGLEPPNSALEPLTTPTGVWNR